MNKKINRTLSLMENLESRTLLAGADDTDLDADMVLEDAAVVSTKTFLVGDQQGMEQFAAIPAVDAVVAESDAGSVATSEPLSVASGELSKQTEAINWATVNLRTVDWTKVDFNSIDFDELAKNVGASILLDFMATHLGERAFVSADGATGGFQMNSINMHWLWQSLVSAGSSEVLHGAGKNIPWNNQTNLPDVNAPLSKFAPFGLDLMSSLIAQASSAAYSVGYTDPGYPDYLRLAKPMWIGSGTVSQYMDSIINSKGFLATLPVDMVASVGMAERGLLSAVDGLKTSLAELIPLLQDAVDGNKKMHILVNAEAGAQASVQSILTKLEPYLQVQTTAAAPVVAGAGGDVPAAAAVVAQDQFPTVFQEVATQWRTNVLELADQLNRNGDSTDAKVAALSAARDRFLDAEQALGVAKAKLESASNSRAAETYLRDMRAVFVVTQALSVALKKLPRAIQIAQTVERENWQPVLGAFGVEFASALVQQMSGAISYGGQLWIAKTPNPVTQKAAMGFIVDSTFVGMQTVFAGATAAHTLAVDWNSPVYENMTVAQYAEAKLWTADLPIDIVMGSMSLALIAKGTYGSVGSAKDGTYGIDNYVRTVGFHLMSSTLNQVANPMMKCMWTFVAKPYILNFGLAQQMSDAYSNLTYDNVAVVASGWWGWMHDGYASLAAKAASYRTAEKAYSGPMPAQPIDVPA